MATIRILLADDHAVLRAGLRLLLNARPDLEVVGEAADTREALEQARALQPDVITLDLTMPGGSSVKLVEQLRKECPQTRALVLTMHDDPAYLRAALAAGAAGYVVKTVADVELIDAIRTICRGRLVVNVGAGKRPGPPAGTPEVRGLPSRPAGFAALSAREAEVFTLLAQGHTNQEMAAALFLSVKTVETYRARIAEKLGLKTRAEIVRYALEAGLLGPGNGADESQAG
jgi:DNA-binding NarL/FixJ family response regulator